MRCSFPAAELLSLEDLENTDRLLAVFCTNLSKDEDFTPLKRARSDFRCAAIRRTVVRRAECGSNAVDYAKFYTRSHDAVICVYDEAGTVIETHGHASDFKECITLLKQKAATRKPSYGSFRRSNGPLAQELPNDFCAFIGQSSRKDIGYAPLVLQRCKRYPY